MNSIFRSRCKILWFIAAIILTLSLLSYNSGRQFLEVIPRHPNSENNYRQKEDPNSDIELLEPPCSVLPTVSSYDRPYIDIREKFVFCWIPKNAGTQFHHLFCEHFAHDNYTGEQEIRDELGFFKYVHDVCKRFIPRVDREPTRLHRMFQRKDYQFMTVIRDPIERLVSAWVDRCHSPGKSIKRRPDYSKTTIPYKDCYSYPFDFKRFANRNYIQLRESSRYNLGWPRVRQADHFMPQYWFCGFKMYQKKYEIFYYDQKEVFREKIRQKFSTFKSYKERMYSGWGGDGALKFLEKPSHSTTQLNITKDVYNSLKLDTELLDVVFRTYSIDYVRLKLPLPRWVQDICNGSRAVSHYAVCRYEQVH